MWIGIGALLVLATAAIPLAVGGSLSGLLDVLVHSDVDYLGNANGAAGGRSVALLLLAGLRLLLVAGAGFWLTRCAARRRNAAFTVITWWLTFDVLGTVVSARGFTHYAQQAEPALALLTALGACALFERHRMRVRLLAAAVVLAAWPATELALLLPRLQVAAITGAAVLPLERHNFDAAAVGGYYSASWRRLFGAIDERAYDSIFPSDVGRAVDVAALFSRVAPEQRVFVWGSIHWVYALSDRLPAGRFVTLNSAYYLDPGNEARLLDDLLRHPPAILVGDAPLPGPLLARLDVAGYQRVRHGIAHVAPSHPGCRSGGDTRLRRGWRPASLPPARWRGPGRLRGSCASRLGS